MTAPLPTRQRYVLPTLELELLNDYLNAISLRLVALESVAGVVVLPVVEFMTGAALGVGVVPFPLLATGPLGFTPRGLVVLAIENLDNVNNAGVPTSAVTAQWAATSGGVVLRYVTGLAVSTRYRLTLGAVRG